MHQLRYLFHQSGLVHLIGQLRYHYAALAVGHWLYLGLCPYQYLAAPRPVCLPYARGSHYGGSRWEIRPRQVCHKLLDGYVPVVYEGHVCVYDLPEVMGRHVCGHAYGYAVAAVYQQIGEAAGQHRGLHQRLVEVGHEVHGIFVYIRQHLKAHFGKPCLGVAHCRRAVPVHAAEVALALHQQVAGVEVLCKAHHGVVDRSVPVGVVFAQHVAHYAGGLMEGLIRGEALLSHRVQYAPVHRLEAVPHIGQGAVYYYRHGVGNEGFLHLLLYIKRRYAGVVGDVVHLLLLYTSRSTTSLLFCSMNSLRGSTLSPIKVENISSARMASSRCTRYIMRLSGSMVVSHS